MIVTVDVTQDDIRDGVRGQCYRCPVARAISRLLVSTVLAQVTPGLVVFPACGTVPPVPLPEHAGRWIDAFDGGYNVRPFSFVLDIPGELLAGAPS